MYKTRHLHYDGRGRWPGKNFRVDFVTLNRNDFEEKNAGDYSWLEFGGFKFLLLSCPFCGFDAPVPALAKINFEEPLDLETELFCGNCLAYFQIIQGVAHRSWIPLEKIKNVLSEQS